MGSVSGKVCALKETGGGKKMHSVFEGFFRANVHFDAKPSKVVREEGDPFFDVGPGFKDKSAVIYINHA